MPLHNHTIILVPRTFELRGASNRHRMRNLAEVYDGSAYKQTQGAFVGRSCNRIGFGQGFLSLARGDRSQRPDLRLLWRVGRSLETHGFQVKVIETTELNRVKARLGVP